MWPIGIKSGFITVLGFIAYGLIIQLIGLKPTLWGGYVVLTLGIYSGHYYYKAANNSTMTYKQGLGIGLIVVSFAGLLNALPVYLYTRFIDADFNTRNIPDIQKTLQQMGADTVIIEKAVQLIQHKTPELLLLGTLVSTMLLGLIFTLVITAFSRHPKKKNTQV